MRNRLVIAVASASALAGLVVVFALWHRLPERWALALTGSCGAGPGVGVMLLQDDPRAADWAVTTAVLGAFTPVHCAKVFGPAGRGR